MHDIKFIRENPEAFDAAMVRRKFAESQSAAILRLDGERRGVQTQLQELQARRNAESQKIGEIKKAKGDASVVMAQVAAMKDEMARLEEAERTVAESLNQHLASLPNILSAEVPDGADEHGNKEVRRWGEPRKDKTPEHFEIGEALGMMDAETAAKLDRLETAIRGDLAEIDRMQTTAGSLALAGNIAAKDAFIAQQLRKAGAVILGKTNLSEWANFRSDNSSSGWSSRGGQTKNPHVLGRNPSGSSSGSSASPRNIATGSSTTCFPVTARASPRIRT